jgi:hypothetical protein
MSQAKKQSTFAIWKTLGSVILCLYVPFAPLFLQHLTSDERHRAEGLILLSVAPALFPTLLAVIAIGPDRVEHALGNSALNESLVCLPALLVLIAVFTYFGRRGGSARLKSCVAALVFSLICVSLEYLDEWANRPKMTPLYDHYGQPLSPGNADDRKNGRKDAALLASRVAARAPRAVAAPEFEPKEISRDDFERI